LVVVVDQTNPMVPLELQKVSMTSSLIVEQIGLHNWFARKPDLEDERRPFSALSKSYERVYLLPSSIKQILIFEATVCFNDNFFLFEIMSILTNNDTFSFRYLK
jgi:hypothetical protein